MYKHWDQRNNVIVINSPQREKTMQLRQEENGDTALKCSLPSRHLQSRLDYDDVPECGNSKVSTFTWAQNLSTSLRCFYFYFPLRAAKTIIIDFYYHHKTDINHFSRIFYSLGIKRTTDLQAEAELVCVFERLWHKKTCEMGRSA